MFWTVVNWVLIGGFLVFFGVAILFDWRGRP